MVTLANKTDEKLKISTEAIMNLQNEEKKGCVYPDTRKKRRKTNELIAVLKQRSAAGLPTDEVEQEITQVFKVTYKFRMKG